MNAQLGNMDYPYQTIQDEDDKPIDMYNHIDID